MDHDTDKLYEAIDRLPGPEDPGWDRLTPSQQQFICMSMIEGQVTNGGFHQVYFNSYQQYVPLALLWYLNAHPNDFRHPTKPGPNPP